LGGPEASGLAEFLMKKYNFIDFIVKGEGEIPLRNLLLHLVGRLHITKVPGLSYRYKPRNIKHTRPPAPLDLTILPSPYRSEDYTKYLSDAKQPVTATFETSRGCSFRCRYCAWSGQKVRFFPLERIFTDLKQLLNHPHVKRIYITDADLLLNKKRGKLILQFLIENNHNNMPIIFEINPELLDDEVIQLLGKFQNSEFAFGLQSTSSRVLNNINRKFNRNRYRNNIAKIKRTKPDAKIWFSLIIGLPGDCLNTFKESLAFAMSMKPYSLYIHELLCLPGSEFFNKQNKYGILCQTEAPHKLVFNKTFGKKDYEMAKELGFYVSLLHYYDFIKNPLYRLWQHYYSQDIVLLHYYERFIEFLRNKVDSLSDTDISKLSSFDFDAYYERITADPVSTSTIGKLFGTFYNAIKKEIESNIFPFKLEVKS
jgi:radical SAM superfamily enzyme YgiQ (UPF0313 family)